MKKLVGWIVVAMLVPVGTTLLLQAQVVCSGGKPTYTFEAVSYCFPTSQGAAGTALTNDGAGNLSWTGATPPDVVTFSTTGSCPAGWTEYTAARGRYIVGLPSGGTNAATVGTALSNTESRPVGQHTHAITDPGHTHAQSAHSHSVSDPGHAHVIPSFSVTNLRRDLVGNVSVRSSAGGTSNVLDATPGVTVGSTTATNQAASAGISIDATGGVLGTNAPYVQLIPCRSTSGS